MMYKHTIKYAGLLLGCSLILGGGVVLAQTVPAATAPVVAAPVAAAPAIAVPQLSPTQAPVTVPAAPVQSAPAAKPVQATAAQAAPAQAVPVQAAVSAAPVKAVAPSPTDSQMAATNNPPPALIGDDRTQRDFIAQYKKCLGNPTRMERLSCYDDIAQTMNLIQSAQKSKEDQILGTYGFWRVIFDQDELGRDKTFLKLDSSNEVKSQEGLSTRPTLTIACQSEKTDVYVDWKYLLNMTRDRKMLPVTFSIDAFPPVQQNWQLSNDNYAVYAPDPARMIRAMKDHLKMIFTMTAETEGTSNLSFDLPGLDNAITILIRRCYPHGINPTNGMAPASDPAHPNKSAVTPSPAAAAPTSR